jgi:hypothetical protein
MLSTTKSGSSIGSRFKLIGMGLGIFLWGQFACAGQPVPAEVFNLLEMNEEQVDELAQGKVLGYTLGEGSADELAVGVARYIPVHVGKVAHHLKKDDPDTMDVDVSASGELSGSGGVAQLGHFLLSKEEAQSLLEAGPGDEFNLSAAEIARFKSFKGKPLKAVLGEMEHQYRELLFHRFEAYRHGGTAALADYAREETLDSSPALELRQAANESKLLAHYEPALYHAWLHYPQTLPKGAEEKFVWVNKTVENRPAAILRHRVSIDWGGGALVLTREYYAAHSYNSSQWLTGCLPWRDGTVVFQQVRTFTDQVAGVGTEAKHFIGRELLKDKMLKSLERLRVVVMEKVDAK